MKLFKKVVEVLIRMMIPPVILALMLGMARIFLDLKRSVPQSKHY